jgi:hypothetical protein
MRWPETQSVDLKVVVRLHAFLAAQGYKVMRNAVHVHTILQLLMPKVIQMTTQEAIKRMPANVDSQNDIR